MAVNPSPFGPKPQFELSDGTPAVGNKLFFYVAGSVNTKQNTYTDSTGGSANTNPIVLNSLGMPTTEIWFTAGQSYKVVYAPSTDTDPPTSPIFTVDNLRGINDTSVTIDQWVASGITPTFVSATSFTLPGDQTTQFHIGRRLKSQNTAGTVYSRISNSVFGALTTVTVVNDGASALDSGLSQVSYGLLTVTNPSFPAIIDASGSNVTITYPNGRPTIAVASSTNTVPRLLENVGLLVTPNSPANAVTISLKGADGNDPSASNVVGISFRNATLTTGTASKVSVVAATSTVISSGSTGGTISATPSRIWIGAILTGGAVEIAWFNALLTATTQPNIAPINEGGLISTTAEGGAGAADTAQVWYSTTARASVPVTVLGYFDSTQTTAGTWAQALTSLVVNPKYRPNDVVQTVRTDTGAVATGTTVVVNDDTIPQIGEGDQFQTRAITATAAANCLRIKNRGNYAHSGANALFIQSIFQDAAANAIKSTYITSDANTGNPNFMDTDALIIAGTTSATTITSRCGATGGTTTFNGAGGARLLGGALNSFIEIQEVVA